MLTGALGVGSKLGLLSVTPLPPPNGPAGNGLIAYDSAGDIWVMGPDGGDPRQLTSGDTVDSSPVWSPDGTRLAYWTQASRSAPASLVVVDADGANRDTVATNTTAQVPWKTDWKPDGSALAYSLCPLDASSDTCDEVVFVAEVDGSGPQLIGDPSIAASRPDWSPDGTRLAFNGTPAGGAPNAYVMGPDGSGIRRLAGLPDGDAFLVDWAPDGSGIVTQAGDPTRIWFAAADDSNSRELSTGPGSDFIAWWSPDGTEVAFLKGRTQLAVNSADGSESRALPVYPSAGFVWSPDATRFAIIVAAGVEIVDAVSGETLARSDPVDQSYPAQVHYPSWQRVVASD